MTEKICQLYKEEQIGKVREGRKAVPSSKFPELGWDITKEIETQVKECNNTEQVQKIEETEATVLILLQTAIATAILILTLLETFKTYIQEIPEIAKKTA